MKETIKTKLVYSRHVLHVFIIFYFFVYFPHKGHQYQGGIQTAQKSFNIRKTIFLKKYCQNTTATREKLANAGLENYIKKIKSEQLKTFHDAKSMIIFNILEYLFHIKTIPQKRF